MQTGGGSNIQTVKLTSSQIGMIAGGVIICIGLIATRAHIDLNYSTDEPDWNLRQFLGVKAMRSQVKLPPGYTHFSIKPLFFVDGNREKTITLSTAEIPKDREIGLELLYGEIDDDSRATLINTREGMTSSTTVRNEIIALLNGQSVHNEPNIVDLPKNGHFYIVGYASSGVDHAGNPDTTGYGDFSTTLRKKKHVMALGVAIFKSKKDQEAARKAMQGSLPMP